MTNKKNQSHEDILKTIAGGRERTNVLKKYEQNLIAYLVPKVPAWMSSNMLTAIGLLGNVFIAICLVLAKYVNPQLLFLSIVGFVINWLGDSLDGRLAYYRDSSRRWFGFSLDVTVDWIGVIAIGLGFIVYTRGAWEILGYLFVVFYAWEVITMLLRYKITGKHSIDSGFIGPTEVRVILASIFVTEVIIPGSINYFAIVVIVMILISNFIETRKILRLANTLDNQEKSR